MSQIEYYVLPPRICPHPKPPSQSGRRAGVRVSYLSSCNTMDSSDSSVLSLVQHQSFLLSLGSFSGIEADVVASAGNRDWRSEGKCEVALSVSFDRPGQNVWSNPISPAKESAARTFTRSWHWERCALSLPPHPELWCLLEDSKSQGQVGLRGCWFQCPQREPDLAAIALPGCSASG
jgi:hypothetical protein